MNNKEAIIAFSQSDKVKSSLIWISQSVEMLMGLPESDKKGAEKIIKAMLDWIANEAALAGQLTSDKAWLEIEKNIDLARVMTNSGVVHEATFHCTQALSHATGIAQRSMSHLVKEGLL